jgi:hypothetical protein
MIENPTEAPETAPERFTIDSESAAAWYLRKLGTIDSEIEAIKAATLQRVEELQADRAGLERRFGGELEAWAREEAERRRRKTVTVPLAGMAVSFRTVAPRLEIEPQKATEIAFTLGFVTPPGEPVADLGAFKAHAEKVFGETGELLPGVRRTEERESVKVGPIKPPKRGEGAPME